MRDNFQEITNGKSPREDLIGIIAYSIFKMREKEYIENYKNKHSKEPSNRDLEQFKIGAIGKQNLDAYRNEATLILNNFIDLAVAQKTKNLKDIIPDKINIQNNLKEKGFFYGVWQSVVGSLIILIFPGLIYFFYWSSQRGIGEVFQEIFFYKEGIVDNKSKKEEETYKPDLINKNN